MAIPLGREVSWKSWWKMWGAVGGAGDGGGGGGGEGAGLEGAGAALSPRMHTCWSPL